MTKIYISPSSQPENKYAYGNTNEQEQCNKIALECVKIAKRCGFEAKTNTNSDMYGRVKESNDWDADVHIPIHTNAANGKVQGTRLFSFDAKGTGYKVCQSIMKTLAPITPGTSDSITVQSFYEITNANAPTAYIEVAFHDNVEEAKWIISHTKEIAEAFEKDTFFISTYVSKLKNLPIKNISATLPCNILPIIIPRADGIYIIGLYVAGVESTVLSSGNFTSWKLYFILKNFTS